MSNEPGEETVREALMKRDDLAPRDHAALLKKLAGIELARGGWTEALQHLDEALRVLSSDDSASAQRIRDGLSERRAWTLFRQGDLTGAKELAEATLARLIDETHPEVVAGLYNTLGGIAWQQGRQAEAIALTSRAADLYERSGDDAGAATARANVGILLFSAGRWSEAEQQFSRADGMRKAIGWDSERPRGLVNLAILEMAQGKRDAARRDLTEAMQLSARLGQRYVSARAELALAHLELLDGHCDNARRHIDAASSSACLCEDDEVQAAWLQALVECDTGTPDRGVELAERARTIAQDAGLLESEADCCRALGVAYRRSKRHADAERTLSDAVALAERSGNHYQRALALLELGEVCHETAAPDRARTSVGEAAEVFRSLGATADLMRANTLRQALA